MNGSTTFSSGNDNWLDRRKQDEIAERQLLIDAAKEGCRDAKARLQAYPHCISELTLDGKEIIKC